MKSAALIVVFVLGAAAAPTVIAQVPAASHAAAAEELLDLMQIEQAMQSSAAAMADAMARRNPQLKPYRQTLLRWAEGFLNWEEMGPRLVGMYTESFTEPELRQMITFYRTPTGRKALEEMPKLTRRGIELGSELANEHMPRLRRMIEQRAAELNSGPE